MPDNQVAFVAPPRGDLRPEQNPDQTEGHHADREDGRDPFCFQISLNFSTGQHRRHEDKNRCRREVNRAVNFLRLDRADNNAG